MLTLALCLAFQRGQVENLPVKQPEVFFPGEREVVLGPLAYRDTVMPMIHSKLLESTADIHGIHPPVWDEYPIGHVRWSVKPDVFATKPCMVLRTEGQYLPKYNFAFKGNTRKIEFTVEVHGTTQWWLAPDGTILRQYVQLVDARGTRTASCTYDKDSIDIQFDIYGQRRITTLYPGDMDKVQAQFKPMIVDGKVVMPEKEYLVYDPFTGGFLKRTAKVSGHFDGTYLSLKFKGTHVDIDGILEDGPIKTYIDDEGDLVKIDLTKDRYVTLGVTPPGKDNGHG